MFYFRAALSDGEVVTRQYTPVTHTEHKSYFELLVKVKKKTVIT